MRVKSTPSNETPRSGPPTLAQDLLHPRYPQRVPRSERLDDLLAGKVRVASSHHSLESFHARVVPNGYFARGGTP
jgi:hypothetical protein